MLENPYFRKMVKIHIFSKKWHFGKKWKIRIFGKKWTFCPTPEKSQKIAQKCVFAMPYTV